MRTAESAVDCSTRKPPGTPATAGRNSSLVRNNRVRKKTTHDVGLNGRRLHTI